MFQLIVFFRAHFDLFLIIILLPLFFCRKGSTYFFDLIAAAYVGYQTCYSAVLPNPPFNGPCVYFSNWFSKLVHPLERRIDIFYVYSLASTQGQSWWKIVVSRKYLFRAIFYWTIFIIHFHQFKLLFNYSFATRSSILLTIVVPRLEKATIATKDQHCRSDCIFCHGGSNAVFQHAVERNDLLFMRLLKNKLYKKKNLILLPNIAVFYDKSTKISWKSVFFNTLYLGLSWLLRFCGNKRLFFNIW